MTSATEAAAAAFNVAIRATGCITANELHKRSGFSPKTIRADLKSGALAATQTVIGGKTVWLIKPEIATAYIEARRERLKQTSAANIQIAQRGRQPPRGYLKPREIVQKWNVSETRLRAAIASGSLKAVVKGSAIFIHHQTWTAFYRKNADSLSKRPIGARSKKNK